MELITRADASYDDLRAVYNGMIDRRPAVIARCAAPADIAAALELARREDLAVAVRAGGHSVAGMSVNDGGMVIDVRPMKDISVDPDGRTVKAGAGVTWAEFDAATQEHGLATTGGRVSSTGIAGFTLGGGSGWAERKFGLACRQPDLSRSRHRGRPASHRQQERAPGPVLVAARRRWQLRGGHRA